MNRFQLVSEYLNRNRGEAKRWAIIRKFLGFVGNGMLSGAVAGLVFASPPTRTISAAIRALAKQNGSRLLIEMNFEHFTI